MPTNTLFTPVSIDDLVEKFDRLMASADEKVLREYKEQRITGSDYATVYLGIMQSAMAQATQFSIQGATTEAEVALLEQKRFTEEANIRDIVGKGLLEDYSGAPGNTDGAVVYKPTVDTPVDPTYEAAVGKGVLGKQQVLFNKQTDGFDRDAEQKLIKVLNDLYGINMSTADIPPAIPVQNNDIGIDNAIIKAKESLGISIATA